MLLHRKPKREKRIKNTLQMYCKKQKADILCFRGNEMAAKIKPVEPTVIKDKRIVREVIAQVRRKQTQADFKRAKKRGELFTELTTR
jgi:hypothetical protein